MNGIELLPTADDPARVVVGHSLASLKRLPDGCISMCACSPPYYGLRAYGTEPQTWGDPGDCDHDWADSTVRDSRHADDSTAGRKQRSNAGSVGSRGVRASGTCRKCNAWRGELGQEPTPELFVAHLVELFREVRRVLHPTGTLWLNCGDSYSSHGAGAAGKELAYQGDGIRGRKARKPAPGYKPKDLLGVPWMLAFALRADGWHFRSGVPWLKRNCMPESVTDRPSNALEYVFLLSKAGRYFYDHAAVRIESNPTQVEHNLKYAREYKAHSDRAATTGQPGNVNNVGIHSRAPADGQRNRRNSDWFFESWQGLYMDDFGSPLAFVVNPVPSDLGHFAMWPPLLVRPMILAGTSAKGNCRACGEPWRRITVKDRKPTRPGKDVKYLPKSDGDGASAEAMGWNRPNVIGNRDPQRHCTEVLTTGWEPGCKCPPADPVPATVLDPFCGTATTLKVAVELGRLGLGLELNPEYAKFAEQRLAEPLGIGTLFPPTAPVTVSLFDV